MKLNTEIRFPIAFLFHRSWNLEGSDGGEQWRSAGVTGNSIRDDVECFWTHWNFLGFWRNCFMKRSFSKNKDRTKVDSQEKHVWKVTGHFKCFFFFFLATLCPLQNIIGVEGNHQSAVFWRLGASESGTFLSLRTVLIRWRCPRRP